MFSQRRLLAAAFGLLAALLLGQVFSLLGQRPAETAVARLYTGEEPLLLTGTVVVETQTIEVPAGDWTPNLRSGEKAAMGQTIFTAPRAEEFTRAARQVRVLRMAQASANKPLISRRQALHACIADLNAADLPDRTAETLVGTLLGEQSPQTLTDWQSAAETQLLALAREDTETVEAPAAGVLLLEADGTVRLATGDVWYLQVELPFGPEVGDTLEAELLGGIFGTVTFTVESVSPSGGGCRLSCKSALAQAAGMTEMTIKILQNSETGLEIPAQAVYTVERETGVWCQVGDQVVWKPVTVLKQSGDRTIVALDRTSTEFLWPGDVVLLGAKEGG